MKAEQSQIWPVFESNTELSSRVKAFLLSRHFPGLMEVDVEENNGTIVLTGRVRTFRERQAAVECCKRVAGVREVIDGLVVAGRAVLKPPHTEARSPHGPTDNVITSKVSPFCRWDGADEF